MQDLQMKVHHAKLKDPGAMEDIMDLFSPLLGKYTRMMQNDEDAASALRLSLMEVVHTVRPDSFSVSSDYALINYFQKTVHHEYIRLSKKQAQKRQNEFYWDNGAEEDSRAYVIPDPASEQPIQTAMLHMMLKQLLTEREYHCIDGIVLRGYTAGEMAQKIGVSKQAVNQCKLRAIKKLRAAAPSFLH